MQHEEREEISLIIYITTGQADVEGVQPVLYNVMA